MGALLSTQASPRQVATSLKLHMAMYVPQALRALVLGALASQTSDPRCRLFSATLSIGWSLYHSETCSSLVPTSAPNTPQNQTSFISTSEVLSL